MAALINHSADELTQEAVAAAASATLGRPVRVFDAIGSTQDEALAWARAGAPEGALVVADHQSAGRGRGARTWVSPPGRSLHLSVVLRPRIAPGRAGLLTTALGVAVAEAISDVHGLHVRLKWPNDVVARSRKLAGILVESHVSGASVDAAVAGVGVNVAWGCTDFPADIAGSATSVACELERAGRTLRATRADLLTAVLERFERLYALCHPTDAKPLVARAAALSDILGRTVVVRLAEGISLEGTAVGLLPDGALEVDTGEGRRAVHAGEVERVRAR